MTTTQTTTQPALADYATAAEISEAARELRACREAFGTQIVNAVKIARTVLPDYRKGKAKAWVQAYWALDPTRRVFVDTAEKLYERRNHLNRIIAKVLTGTVPAAYEINHAGRDLEAPVWMGIVKRIEAGL